METQVFDLWLLRSFVAVAESGGFTRAAARLNSTQSTISAQIQRLEEDVGKPLFVRSTRSVRLTPAGDALLGYARTILRLNEDARMRLSSVRHAGRVRLGVNEDLTATWLPALLQQFARRYPNVAVELMIGLGSHLFTMVDAEALDLAVGSVCHGPVEGRRLWTEPLVWAYAADAELAPVVPLAVFPEPCPYREAALRALAAGRRQWRIVSTSSSLAGVRAAAMAGLAVTPLPAAQTITPRLRPLGARDKMPGLPKVEYVLRVRRSESRPMVSALADVIQEVSTTDGRVDRDRGARARRR